MKVNIFKLEPLTLKFFTEKNKLYSMMANTPEWKEQWEKVVDLCPVHLLQELVEDTEIHLIQQNIEVIARKMAEEMGSK